MTAEERFRAVQDEYLHMPGVSEGTGFGNSPGLRVDNKIFAMLLVGDQFVLKLPKPRVDELCAAGHGERLATKPDRPMKEWVSIDPAADLDWPALAQEAFDFVRP